MRVGKLLLMITGVVVLLSALAMTAAGSALLWANATQRDASGYFTTPAATFRSSGAALVSSVDFAMRPGPSDWVAYHPLGTVRVRANVASGGTFVGIARTSAVDTFLAGVAYDRVQSVRVLPFRAEYRPVAGSATATDPSTLTIWRVSATGVGVQQITWRPESGKWTLVVMRADAASRIVAKVSVGTNTGVVLPFGLGLTAGGVLLLFAGGLLFGFGVIGLGRSRRSDLAADAPTPAGVGVGVASPNSDAYPVRLDARLDEPLSRWRWIVKWFLILPHAVVLMFMWLAVGPLTMLAGLSILFTGRYPRSIFDFTVGVIRWTWRVGFYAFSALGTDRYPPFSLERNDSYPAAFDVDYPAQLSKGLVLVKWWLLAIPQYIIVGILMGGGVGFTRRLSSTWSFATSGGVIGLLVVVAGLVLLFTGRYPRQIFEFVMGLNRWCYRVFAYVLLLRDEYPPFRLDAGGTDPGSVGVGAGGGNPVAPVAVAPARPESEPDERTM